MALKDLLNRAAGRPPAAAPDTVAPYTRALVDILAHHGLSQVLDVGANEGQYARRLLAAGFAGRIVSVEPGAAAHARLSTAAAGHARWTVAPRLALGETAGEASLQRFDRTDMSSLLAAEPTATEAFPKLTRDGTERVSVARLDAVFEELLGDAVDVFLKLDTQGSELAVLAGAAGVLPRIAGLEVEIAVTPLYRGQPALLEVMTAIESLGYRPVLTSPGYYSKRLKRQIDLDVVYLRA